MGKGNSKETSDRYKLEDREFEPEEAIKNFDFIKAEKTYNLIKKIIGVVATYDKDTLYEIVRLGPLWGNLVVDVIGYEEYLQLLREH